MTSIQNGADLLKRKFLEDGDDEERKIRRFLTQQMDRMETTRRQLNENKTKLANITKHIDTIHTQIAMNQRRIEHMQDEIESRREVNNMYVGQERDLKRQKIELLASVNDLDNELRSVETTTFAVAAASLTPPRADLKSVYESKAECSVCMAEHEGKDILYMNNCTHAFCRFCVTRAEPQYRCMECRAAVSAVYAIVKCGERYRLKSYKVCVHSNHNFEDRIQVSTDDSDPDIVILDDTPTESRQEQHGSQRRLRTRIVSSGRVIPNNVTITVSTSEARNEPADR